MIEQIKKEICKLRRQYIEMINARSGDFVNINEVIEILDKYKDIYKPKDKIVHIGRGNKMLRCVNEIVNYISENNLTKCEISILEVPNKASDDL